jgi:predicted short-subunit dehydrogenase-like oxidoreductase (DUF2520 family)
LEQWVTEFGLAHVAWGDPAPEPGTLRGVRTILLTVRDDAIPSLAAALRPEAGSVVLHASGALPASALGELPDGVHGGAWHPLQAFAALDAQGAPEDSSGLPPLPYAVAVDGDETALARARALAQASGHPAVYVPPEGRAAYHAAAVLAAGCFGALEAVATRVAVSAGIPAQEAWTLLRPLVAGTARNLVRGGPMTTITGPVARGDAGTVSRNLGALAGDPPADALYRLLGGEVLRLARELGLGPRAAGAVEAVLRHGSGPGPALLPESTRIYSAEDGGPAGAEPRDRSSGRRPRRARRE